jgi:hypothetical protein
LKNKNKRSINNNKSPIKDSEKEQHRRIPRTLQENVQYAVKK